MEKKRSVGVMVFGRILIIYGLFVLCGCTTSPEHKIVDSFYSKLINSDYASILALCHTDCVMKIYTADKPTKEYSKKTVVDFLKKSDREFGIVQKYSVKSWNASKKWSDAGIRSSFVLSVKRAKQKTTESFKLTKDKKQDDYLIKEYVVNPVAFPFE